MSDDAITCPRCGKTTWSPTDCPVCKLVDDVRQLREENERLQAENQGYRYQLRHVTSERDDILSERNQFSEENERLRKALRAIVSHQELLGGGLGFLSTTRKIAQNALDYEGGG